MFEGVELIGEVGLVAPARAAALRAEVECEADTPPQPASAHALAIVIHARFIGPFPSRLERLV